MRKFLKTAVAAMGICLLLTACGQSKNAAAGSSESSSSTTAKSSNGYTVIDAEAAKQMMDDGNVVVVDVRTAEEYAEEHIPDAINIPVESIGTKKPSKLPDTEAVILVYCRTGIRAASASDKLAAMGYTHVYDMGGIVDWPYDTVS